jgi:hypothetical protein
MTEPVAQWSPEAAYAEFVQRYGSLFDNNANEADTRLKAIDEIFFEVLDWTKPDVETEKYCRSVGFADYVFKTNQVIALVVEAKRAGVAFTLAHTKFRTEPVCFALLEKESPSAGDALRQAIGYAASLGSRYVAITNGHQWILALTYVHSQAVEERQVIIFDSLKAITDNFRRFWTCFSRTSLTANEILPALLESRKRPAPPKLSTRVPGYPSPSHRNRFVNELSYILNIVWDVLSRTEHTKTFLENCYVAAPANEHLLTFAKDLLKRRIAADKVSLAHEVSNAGPTEMAHTIIGYQNEKPFVVLGDVGRGKTTFLSYLREVAGKDLFQNYVQIEANFLDRPDNAAEVSDFIYGQIEAQMLTRHNVDVFDDSIVRGALHIELERFRNSSRFKIANETHGGGRHEESAFIQEKLKDRHLYFQSVVRHLKKGRGKSVAVFFDNLDRRDASIQEAAFLKASAIARDWECVVFICLRPTTFYASLKRGLLDSLAPKTFTIGSPDLPLILKRRFQFAEKLALGEVDTPILQDALRSKEISFKLPSVAQIFACCEFSARKGASAIDMLAALSNGNIRVLLELTKRTIISGHLDTGKILGHIQRDGTYYVPDFEAVKTLLYGDYDHYDPKFSIFVNLFDVFHADAKEHFIRILILDYLNRFHDQSSGHAWVPYADLLNYLESFYFDLQTIQRHLKVLLEGECIESEIGVAQDESNRTRIRINTRGSYHVTKLICEFQYIDAVIIDTPVVDPDLASDLQVEKTLPWRIQRARNFLAYLISAADQLVDIEGRETCLRLLREAAEECSVVESKSQSSPPRR